MTTSASHAREPALCRMVGRPRPRIGPWVFVGALVGCAVLVSELPRPSSCPSKTERARLEVRRFAFEAAPRWTLENPDRVCPTLSDLRAHVPGTGRDPWGGWYWITCDTPDLRIIVGSAGEDGQLDTDDDIRSDR